MRLGTVRLHAPMPVVLQVVPRLITGGVERSTVEITQALTGAGWTALVASEGGPLVREIERAGGGNVRLPLDHKDPVSLWRNATLLARLIRDAQVDVVHARSRGPAWSAWFAVRRTGRHFVTTYHGAYGENLPLKRRYNSVMAMGERVIVASRFMAGLVSARHGVGPDRLRLIPRGVDPGVFDPAAVPPERIDALRHDWSIEPGASVIALPGRITGWKGQTVLLQAAARMQRRDPVIVLVGATQGKEHLRSVHAEAERLGLAERLRVPGDCGDMPAALALADVVVHASTEPEAFGRVVIEAQAMARPVIASDLGGPVETVEDGVTGWRTPPGDAQALGERLDAVLAMGPAGRARIGTAARAAVLRDFTTKAMQEGTLAVYREVLGI